MTFDNSKTIISLRIKLFAVTVLLLGYFFLTYITEIIKYPLLGMSDAVWTTILIGLYILYAIYPMFLNYQYVYYSDDGDSIIFRYFMAGIVGGRKNTIEIKKNYFAGYRTETRYFGLMQNIILSQRIGEGIANYPPVFISNLTKEEKGKVLRSLNLYVRANAGNGPDEHE